MRLQTIFMLSAVQQLADRARRSFEFRRLRRASEYWRKRFTGTPPEKYVSRPCGLRLPGVEVVSLCGKVGLPLQSLSMLSFLRHVGTPSAWNVVSDGSIDDEAREHLRRVCPTVRFTLWSDYVTDENRAAVEVYEKKSFMAKKLALVTSLKPDPTTFLYTDTDVVFFAGGARLHSILSQPARNRFLLDNIYATDHTFCTAEEIKMPPLNAGFIIQTQPIPWTEPLARLVDFFSMHPDLCEQPKVLHNLEQSVCHVGYHLSDAQPLPQQFVLQLDDAFDFSDRYIHPDTVLRHYVWHTRMKFWLHAQPYLP